MVYVPVEVERACAGIDPKFPLSKGAQVQLRNTSTIVFMMSPRRVALHSSGRPREPRGPPRDPLVRSSGA